MNNHIMCSCGKNKGKLNETNWKRHKEACNKKNIYSSNIKKFFLTETLLTTAAKGNFIPIIF